MKHILTITPAVDPKTRHFIEKVLEQEGYEIHGGGQHIDGSSSDISFSRDEKSNNRYITKMEVRK